MTTRGTFVKAVRLAERRAMEDSNDKEIDALRTAVDIACELLHVTMAELKQPLPDPLDPNHEHSCTRKSDHPAQEGCLCSCGAMIVSSEDEHWTEVGDVP